MQVVLFLMLLLLLSTVYYEFKKYKESSAICFLFQLFIGF